jgi:carboxyl-terminal processing protease
MYSLGGDIRSGRFLLPTILMTARQRNVMGAGLVLALVLGATGGWVAGAETRATVREANRLAEVVRLVADQYVVPMDRDEVYQKSITGLVSGLDPNSRYYTPADYEAFRLTAFGEYAGIGAEVGVRGGAPTVIAPLPSSPAERAGLRAGDRIMAIDGDATEGWSQQKVVQHLRGRSGTVVTIDVARLGSDNLLPVRLRREEIRVDPVPSAILMGDIGYVEVAGFGPGTAARARAAFDGLVARGARGLVIDVRRNPGGIMEEAIEIADLFLERGVGIAELRGRRPDRSERFLARSRDRYDGIPVAILVEASSASASEILAGALQDHGRAVVLGQSTFGKGSVQTAFPLRDGHRLVLTTGRWYTPGGRSIERVAGSPDGPAAGIVPDVLVALDTLVGAERALAHRLLENGYGVYLDARLNLAVRLLHQDPDLGPDFQVTTTMIDELHAELERAGAAIDRAEYDAASDWIARGLAADLAYSRWGEAERRRRQNQHDNQVQEAMALLAGVIAGR